MHVNCSGKGHGILESTVLRRAGAAGRKSRGWEEPPSGAKYGKDMGQATASLTV